MNEKKQQPQELQELAIPDLSSAPRIVDPSVRITRGDDGLNTDICADRVHMSRHEHRVGHGARQHSNEIADLIL